MSDSNALGFDRAGRIEEAARAYESAITRGEATISDLLNLAVLYWQSTDPGMAAAENFGAEFFEQAGRRFPELLAEASRRDPVSTEVRFWRQYIAWAELGEEFGLEACQGLLREDPTVLETRDAHLRAQPRRGSEAGGGGVTSAMPRGRDGSRSIHCFGNRGCHEARWVSEASEPRPMIWEAK